MDEWIQIVVNKIFLYQHYEQKLMGIYFDKYILGIWLDGL
jgi:hypothetical protein